MGEVVFELADQVQTGNEGDFQSQFNDVVLELGWYGVDHFG